MESGLSVEGIKSIAGMYHKDGFCLGLLKGHLNCMDCSLSA